MARPRTVPAMIVAPTHTHPAGIPALVMADTCISTVALPEGHFTAIVSSVPHPTQPGRAMAQICILDHDEVDEHIRLLRNSVADAKLMDKGLPPIFAKGRKG